MKLIISILLVLSSNFQVQLQSNHSKKEAKMICNKIVSEFNNGVEFKDLVSKYSEDIGSKSNGGLFTEVPREYLVKEVVQQADKLNKNEISRPFTTVYGYTLIQLIDRTDKTISMRYILINIDKKKSRSES